jgi:hypothetical protein
MAPSPDRIYLLARSVLDAIVAGYADAGIPLPAHQLVTPGLPAWDCEGVYVQVERTYGHDGDVATEVIQARTAHAAHTMRAIAVAVTVLRCVPDIEDLGNGNIVLPDPVEEEAAAELILTDAQRLLNILVAAQRQGDIGGCNGLAFDQWQSVGPESGLGGGILHLRLNVGV